MSWASKRAKAWKVPHQRCKLLGLITGGQDLEGLTRSETCMSSGAEEHWSPEAIAPEAGDHVDGGSPRSTASQDVGGLSPASSGNLDTEADEHRQHFSRTQSLVRAPGFLLS